MNIFSLTGLIALLAVGVTIIFYFIRKPENLAIEYLKNFLGTFFIFSGVVKAIDPIGTSIKLEEYFTIFTEYVPFLEPLWNLCASLALPIAVFTIVLEIALGISLLLGTLKRSTLFLYVGLIIFFTFLTGFSAWTGKVTDCGCFGDFVKLKPFESFIKDLFLMVIVFIVVLFHKHVRYIFKNVPSLILLGVLSLASLAFCYRNISNLPIVDFRAYQKGTDLIKGKDDSNLNPGKSIKLYTLENATTGESKQIDSDEYMSSGIWKDKTWVLNKDKTEIQVIEEPELPKIKDFFIYDADGNEIQDEMLDAPGFKLLVPAYDITKTSSDDFKAINEIVSKSGLQTYGITASDIAEAQTKSGSLYTFYNLDATPIKTMIRANPGLVLLKGGVLVDKWHGNHVPSWEEMKKMHGIK